VVAVCAGEYRTDNIAAQSRGRTRNPEMAG